MEFEIMSGLSELGFKLARGILKYYSTLAHLPVLNYIFLGFGSLIVFTKNHINPKSWKRIRKRA